MALEEVNLNQINNLANQNIICTNEENLLLCTNQSSIDHKSNDIEYERNISFLKLFWTLLTMMLFISDIFSDLILAIYFYINDRKSTCIFMLIIIYMSSLFSSLFERHTRKQSNGFIYYIRGILIFTFNLSGILLYKEIIQLNLKELRIINKYSNINEKNRKILEEKKRDLAFLKLIEGITEAFPQIFYQIFVINEIRQTDGFVSLLQYATLSTSFLGLATTGVGFVMSVTPDIPEPDVFLLIIKFLWLICTTVSRLLSIYLLVFINYSAIPFLVVFNIHLQIGRVCYAFTSEKPSKNNTTKCSFLRNEFPGTLYGLLFVITPYISCKKKDYYENNSMTAAHLFHFIQIFIVTILWAINQPHIYNWNAFVYVSLIIISIGGFIMGVIFLIIFKKYKPKDITNESSSDSTTTEVLVE